MNEKVTKKRRKMGKDIIYINDYKMFALDFFREIEFNIHEGCGTRPANNCITSG